MTELYLDCEWNGKRRSFISLALYNPKGESFYEVDNFWMQLNNVKSFDNSSYCMLEPWVLENVIPKLLQTAIPKEIVKARLGLYLNLFEDDVTIYADWPLDFNYMCELLIDDSKDMPRKLVEKLTMKLITTSDTHISKIPHNALEDAKALYLNHLEMKNV